MHGYVVWNKFCINIVWRKTSVIEHATKKECSINGRKVLIESAFDIFKSYQLELLTQKVVRIIDACEYVDI